MHHFNWLTFDEVMDRIVRDTGYSDLSELDCVTWMSQALGQTNTTSEREERVAFGEVENNIIKIPKGLVAIRRIAMHKSFKKEWKTERVCGMGKAFMRDLPDGDDHPCPDRVIEPAPTGDCCEKHEVDCNGCIINLPSKVWYRPFFDMLYMHDSWKGSRYYKDNYTPVVLTNNDFFNTLVCKDDLNYPENCPTYNVVGDSFVFSFDCGSVAISYYRAKLDNKGLPMLPDTTSHIEAVVRYIEYKMASRAYNQNPGDPSLYRKKKDAESDWQWYCGQTKTLSKMPGSHDELERIMREREKFIPNSHFGYFGYM